MRNIKYILFLASIILCLQKVNAQTVQLFDITDSISHISMPNVFTPNYDSINDVFKPYLDEITTMSFSIFNRYGNVVFETNRVNGFWDGRTTSGEPCNDGVYFCALTATGIDGKQFKEKTFVQLFTGKK